MNKQMFVWGPPGTGKTEYVRRAVESIANKRNPDEICCVSFTRTAAGELASRVPLVPKKNTSTLHGFAFRGLGLTREQVAEQHLKDWNEDCKDFAISSAYNVDPEDGPPIEAPSILEADLLLSAYNINRARMVDREDMPETVQAFADKWEDWKSSNGLFDFQDMIDYGLRDLGKMPGNPVVTFADEYQDFTQAEQALINKWAGAMELVIKVGDSDQSIYSFKGVNPDSMVLEAAKVPDNQKRPLLQSYTLPPAIHTIAVNWIKRVKLRENVEFLPRQDIEGEVARLPDINYRNPQALLKAVDRSLSRGESTMILASCSYMLEPILKQLREAGVPFHNAYRKSRGDWNPLSPGSGIGAVERILSFLHPSPELNGEAARFWTKQDVAKWASILESDKALIRGGKKLLEGLTDETEIDSGTLLKIFQPEALARLWELDVNFFKECMLKTKLNSNVWQFVFKIIEKRGAGELKQEPLLTVGTIHSVKGGRAEHVILCPDLSQRGMLEYIRGNQDAIRLFYVGMTRARSKLTVLGAVNYDLALNLF